MFYDIYSDLCADKGVSLSKAAEDNLLSRTSVVKWKNGSIPSGATIQKLALYFGVSVDLLLGNAAASFQLEKEDKTKPAANSSGELQDYLEELKNRSEMRMLFSVSKNATKEDIMRAVAIIEALKKEEEGGK